MWEYRAKLARIIDGDTIDVSTDLGFGMDGLHMRLRLLGVDTPERNQLGYNDAIQYVADWFATHCDSAGWFMINTIQNTQGRDKADSFGRYLTLVWSMDKMFSLNQELMAKGWLY